MSTNHTPPAGDIPAAGKRSPSPPPPVENRDTALIANVDKRSLRQSLWEAIVNYPIVEVRRRLLDAISAEPRWGELITVKERPKVAEEKLLGIPPATRGMSPVPGLRAHIASQSSGSPTIPHHESPPSSSAPKAKFTDDKIDKSWDEELTNEHLWQDEIDAMQAICATMEECLLSSSSAKRVLEYITRYYTEEQ